MFNISSYLEKFRNIGVGERQVKEVITSSIKEVTGVVVEIKNITIKNGEATIKTSPGLKNAIYIKKELILNKIREKQNGKILDLR